MSLPDEKYRAIKKAREFMRDLLDPKKTPKIPSAIRERAASCLKHFPWEYDMKKVAEECPEIFDNPDKDKSDD